MQVAAGRLDPPSRLDASGFDWIKAAGADECLCGRSGGVVISGVEQNGPLGFRLAAEPSASAPRVPNVFT